jgi:hypothetical protein
MNQLIFIIILLVILVLLKMYYLCERFELANSNLPQLDDNIKTEIYNHFYQKVLNPYKYPMTPFFSNDSQELPNQNYQKF